MIFRKSAGAIALAVSLFALPANSATLVVNGDEWTLSDNGFAQAGVANVDRFVANLVDEFGPSIHAFSTNFGFTEPALAAAMAAAGATYTTGLGIAFDLPTLDTFDAILLGGDYLNDAQEAVLASYIAGGGNVYIAAGTGLGGAAFEAAQWNDFLAPFGIELGPVYDGPSGVLPVVSADPLLAGVSALFSNGANTIVAGDVICCGPDGDLIAVWRSDDPPGEVPLPASALLLLAGLAGMASTRLRR